MPVLTRSVRIMLTASEAYPALERAYLGAVSEIWSSFLVFDLTTKLRSPEALAIGRTWFDLVVHTLNRGVSLNIVISDVDPIARAAMHRTATRHLRLFSAAAAVANPGARLKVTRARHPAETGPLVRLAIWPYIMRKVFRTAGWLNRLSPERRAAALRDMDGAAENLRVCADGKIAVRLFSLPRLYPAIHHQKLAVIDRKLLYVGGLDLDERRYDTVNHGRAGNQTWHDVQLMIEGPVATEAQQHLESFREVIEGRMSPPRTRRLLRTLSRPMPQGLWNFGPEPLVEELRTAHHVLVRRAMKLIYLESQYFRDVGLAKELAEAARRSPGLQLVLILPAAPDEVAFERKRGLDSRFGEAMQARALRIVRKAFGLRLFVGSPAQPRPALPDGEGEPQGRRDRLHGAPLIYVHAKVSIFDDSAAIVSSANLNGRSLRWDTEAGVYLTNENDVVDLRHRVMAHWLPQDSGSEAFEAPTAVSAWARVAWQNAAKPPAQRKGFLLPHDFAAAEAFGRNLPVLPPEFV
jgi:phosphatidylserine/phosphatidylglycerophosphate/cardiolipin synthase-like enzyme